MIRVRAYKYYKRATFYFQEFTREHETEILRADRRNLMVILRNGDELHFVCERDFDRWGRGRKYRIEEWE